MMKKEVRIIGFDDGPFDRNSKGDVLVVGTIFRGGNYMDGLLSTKVRVEGNNATDKLTSIINKTRHKPQLQYIMLDGIAFGGFNVVDIHKLNEKTKLPVIVVIRKIPDFEKIKKVLKKIGQEKKIKLIEKAGNVYKAGKIYIQIAGVKLETAKGVVKVSTTHSLIPEPIRIAHLIASGVVDGESRGRA
jgi:endonuclease V-like protein UPF0215 family